jgi:hypothetical protein
MSGISVEQETSLNNYEILNSITPVYYRKKFPYNIIPKNIEPNIELTHKNVDLVYIKDKKYFVKEKNHKKYKKGGIYGGSAGKITVYLL